MNDSTAVIVNHAGARTRKEREAERPPSQPGAPSPSNVADGEVIDAEPVEARQAGL